MSPRLSTCLNLKFLFNYISTPFCKEGSLKNKPAMCRALLIHGLAHSFFLTNAKPRTEIFRKFYLNPVCVIVLFCQVQNEIITLQGLFLLLTLSRVYYLLISYQIMLRCWEENPVDRPTFEKLKKTMKEIERNHKVRDSQRSVFQIQCKLGYFFISKNMQSTVKDVKILPNIFSDHSV